jgi:molybdopterin-guanine dinucleotide biosynthesis protein A
MLTIVIQAGGQSTRMGQNKALMPFLGKPLIQRMVERVRPIADELILVTNSLEPYRFLGLPSYSDLLPGRGNLGGLYTALSVAKQPLAAVLACDMPFVNTGLLAAQRDLLLSERCDVVIPRSQEGMEPLHSVYRCETCLPAIRAALDAGERRMISWFSVVRVRELSIDEIRQHDPDGRAFINVNTPEEFHQAELLEKE